MYSFFKKENENSLIKHFIEFPFNFTRPPFQNYEKEQEIQPHRVKKEEILVGESLF